MTNCSNSPLTTRARLERHRSNPQCAACHAKMDPLGFALENLVHPTEAYIARRNHDNRRRTVFQYMHRSGGFSRHGGGIQVFASRRGNRYSRRAGRNGSRHEWRGLSEPTALAAGFHAVNATQCPRLAPTAHSDCLSPRHSK